MFIQINNFKTRKMSILVLSVVVSLIAQLFVASPAQAECIFEGVVYQTGETVGALVCTPDGTWQP